jgi:hypothetical protein
MTATSTWPIKSMERVPVGLIIELHTLSMHNACVQILCETELEVSSLKIFVLLSLLKVPFSAS